MFIAKSFPNTLSGSSTRAGRGGPEAEIFALGLCENKVAGFGDAVSGVWTVPTVVKGKLTASCMVWHCICRPCGPCRLVIDRYISASAGLILLTVPSGSAAGRCCPVPVHFLCLLLRRWSPPCCGWRLAWCGHQQHQWLLRPSPTVLGQKQLNRSDNAAVSPSKGVASHSSTL